MANPSNPYFVDQVLYRVLDYPSRGFMPRIDIKHYYVDKVTPRGAWIVDRWAPGGARNYSERRWIPIKNNRRLGVYATPTVEEALRNAIYKRAFHVARLEEELREAKRRLAALHELQQEKEGNDEND